MKSPHDSAIACQMCHIAGRVSQSKRRSGLQSVFRKKAKPEFLSYFQIVCLIRPLIGQEESSWRSGTPEEKSKTYLVARMLAQLTLKDAREWRRIGRHAF